MFQYFASVAVGYIVLRSIRYYRYLHKFLPKQYKLSKHSNTKIKKPTRNPLRDGFTKRKIPSDLDVIVIGSGISGLATAAFLSRVGKKVLVVEQHYIAGGCTHTYEDKGFEFDTGIHYETGSRNQAKFGIALKNIGTGMAFNGDGDDVTLMGESYESTFEIRSENFELPALLHIGGSYDFLFNDIHTVMLCLNFTSNSF